MPVGRGHEGSRRASSTRSAYISAVAGYYTAPNGQMLSFPFNSSTTDLLLQQGRLQGGRPRPRTRRPRPGPRWSPPPPSSRPPATSAPSPPAGRAGPSSRASRPGTTRCSRRKNNGFGGTGRAPDVQLAAARAPHREPGEHGQAGPVRLQGPRQRARRDLPLGRMRHDHRLLGPLRAASPRTPSSPTASPPLPYYPDVPGAPQNTVIGGASLWVMAGKKPAEYKGVAEFFSFLSTPEVQSASHKRTGYLPITTAAYELTEKSGFYKENPGTDVAVTQMIRKTTDKSRGIRLGNFVQIRAIDGRGDSSRSGPARRRRRKRSTPPSSAATSSSSASRKRTRAEAAARRRHAATPAVARRAAAPPAARRASFSRRLVMEKRVVFRSRLAALGCCSRRRWRSSCVFFFWPASQALLQSLQQQDAFGTSTEWVGLENFRHAVRRPDLRRVLQDHGAVLGAGGRLRHRHLAAAGGVRRPHRCAAAMFYKTLLILPYAVAPAVAGVLWVFMFSPSLGVVAYALRRAGHRLEPPAQLATTR